MIKRSRILALFGFVSLVALLTPPLVYACDPLGCLLIGKDQDILALVTILEVNIETNQAVAFPEHIYQERGWKEPSIITIVNTTTTGWNTMPLRADQQYFVSLACKEKVCIPKWGTWEVDGRDFRTAKLRKIRSGDDAAIQWFLNGRGTSFYGEHDKMYANTPNGSVEIYPKYPHLTQETEVRLAPTKKLIPILGVCTLIGFLSSIIYYHRTKFRV